MRRNFKSTTLVSRFRSSQALAVHSRANFGIKGTLALMTLVWFLDLKSYTSSLQMRRNFKSTTLVSRFRSSQALAAHSRANFGIKGTLALMTLVWFLDLKFLYEFAANA